MTESHDFVVLGRVVGAHALRGEVRVRILGDGPGHLFAADTVHLSRDHQGSAAQEYEISKSGTGRSGEVRLALVGVGDRSSAEALRGLLVLGDKRNLPELGDDEFYWHEVVGCDVVSDDGTEIGRVREIWETGAHDVLVVEGATGQQILLPTAREIMTHVDLDARRVVIHVLPGLLDPDA